MSPSRRGEDQNIPTAIPSTYRKKPVVVQAIPLTEDNLESVARWCGGRPHHEAKASDHTDVAHWLDIPTLEGVMRGSLGDYIIRGVSGEYYPVKPEIFELTYERDGLIP